jgi:hypothetical protein
MYVCMYVLVKVEKIITGTESAKIPSTISL